MNEDIEQKLAKLHENIVALKNEVEKRKKEREEQENDPRRYYSCTDYYCD